MLNSKSQMCVRQWQLNMFYKILFRIVVSFGRISAMRGQRVLWRRRQASRGR